jgi:hypothetical protein
MKTINYLASTALVLTTLTATPAFANSPSSAGLLTMQAACNAAKPNDTTSGSVNSNNGITTHTYAARVVNVVGSPTTRVVTGALVEVTPAATVPVLTPATFVPLSEARRGGSPNIHGEFVATATYAGAVSTQTVTTYTGASFVFSCAFDKTTNGTTNLNWKVEAAATPLVEEGAGVSSTRTITGDPVIQREFSDGVICNSPGTKKGEWRAQNGYTGTCSTAVFETLLGKTVTSNSLPNFTPVHGDPEGDTGGGFSSNPHVNPVIDTDPEAEQPAAEG